ncbi:MAG: hypothetical protein Q9P01_18015 [Anaerolineae bacterium]|nr:hypothetical protein [Anaerolineae bacterium]
MSSNPADVNEAQIGYIFASLLAPVENDGATAVAQAEEPESTTVNAQVADVSPTATATPTATAMPNIVPTATPDGDLPIVTQICPVGALPINPSDCATVTPTGVPGLPELTGNGLLLARDVTLSSLFVPTIEPNIARKQSGFLLPYTRRLGSRKPHGANVVC